MIVKLLDLRYDDIGSLDDGPAGGGPGLPATGLLAASQSEVGRCGAGTSQVQLQLVGGRVVGLAVEHTLVSLFFLLKMFRASGVEYYLSRQEKSVCLKP